jgi:hypothetical protein
MRRLFRALLVIVPLAVLVAACSSDVSPTLADPVKTTDKLEGALTVGTTNYHIVQARNGDVKLVMKGIGPDPGLKLGLRLGLYSSLTCSPIIDNGEMKIGNFFTGTNTSGTTLCVEVYDPGTIPTDATVTYELSLTYFK